VRGECHGDRTLHTSLPHAVDILQVRFEWAAFEREQALARETWSPEMDAEGCEEVQRSWKEAHIQATSGFGKALFR